MSQDGQNAAAAAVIAQHGARQLVHPRRVLTLPRGSYICKWPGYAYLSVHYGWALTTLFEQVGSGGAPAHESVIILEEDIEVTPDFFAYFTATSPLLHADPTLLAVSAVVTPAS